MAEATSALQQERIKSQYLNRDRSVNIKEHFAKQEALEKSGLDGVEIMDRAKSLGKDDFLKILVTQLTHQDPTKPMQDQEFIAQMAQFSSLEQMQNISKNISKMTSQSAMSLVGKFIQGPDSNSGDTISGVATAMVYDEAGKSYLRLSTGMVAADDIEIVSDPDSIRKATESVSELMKRADALSSGNRATPSEAQIPGKSGQDKIPSAHLPESRASLPEKEKSENNSDEQTSVVKKANQAMFFYESHMQKINMTKRSFSV